MHPPGYINRLEIEAPPQTMGAIPLGISGIPCFLHGWEDNLQKQTVICTFPKEFEFPQDQFSLSVDQLPWIDEQYRLHGP
jgi:hypothetical protein